MTIFLTGSCHRSACCLAWPSQRCRSGPCPAVDGGHGLLHVCLVTNAAAAAYVPYYKPFNFVLQDLQANLGEPQHFLSLPLAMLFPGGLRRKQVGLGQHLEVEHAAWRSAAHMLAGAPVLKGKSQSLLRLSTGRNVQSHTDGLWQCKLCTTMHAHLYRAHGLLLPMCSDRGSKLGREGWADARALI